MAPRTRPGDHLTGQDLTDLAAAVSAGKRATVYLNEATPSLGLAAGCSAKVVSVDGTTVLIRPKGVNDELPFEADELRLTRAPAKQAAKAAPKPAAAPGRTRSASARSALDRSAAGAPTPSAPPRTSTPPAPTTAKAAVTAPNTDVPHASSPTPAPKRPRRAKEPAGVSVTLHAAAGGEWTVTVTHGAKRPGKAAPVAADAVERAVRELGDPTAQDAVESVITAARDAAAKRVEELSRQLEEARTALESLGT
ncbi:DUF6319 family protein [Rhodococcus sp. NPDC058532]|uniref:DUF6319 family protein n=1 Tax=Rhodococcus sp. NPDC058532 TaxID=3346540 RepID=UPI0036531943